MKANSRFEMSMVGRAGVLSSLISLASTGSSFGQEPLALENLKLLRPPNEACTVTFEAEEELQVIVWSSTDLDCWNFSGRCVEFDLGDYQFIDVGAIELPGQFYKFEIFDPQVELPPQFEQLRAELGDEGFSQWLQSNEEQFGTLQGISPEQIAELPEDQQEQVQQIEGLLEYWLRDFLNESAPPSPELVLPPIFEELRIDWGDYDFAKLLVGHMDDFGNFQGICPPLVLEWQEQEPPIYIEFQTEEQRLGQWLENYLIELPPLVLENFEPQPQPQPLPPQYEQLRMELGDEGFAQWLSSNREQFGNHQGIIEGELPEEALEPFQEIELILEAWLTEFEKIGIR